MKNMKIRLTFTETVLGMSPGNKNLYMDYIASKSPDAASIEDEIASIGVDGVAEKGITVFPKLEDGTPFIWDYQIKGMFKDSCGGLRRAKGTESSKIKAFKKEIDKLIFVKERKIPLENYGEITRCQRPIRVPTPQGEATSIAVSEEVSEGSTATFTIVLWNEDHEKLVREWLNYGVYFGFGQWRSSGKGRFVWEELDKKGAVIGGNKHN